MKQGLILAFPLCYDHTMKKLFLVLPLLLLVSCAHSDLKGAPDSKIPSEMVGQWDRTGMECANNKFTEFGQAQKKADNNSTEFWLISESKAEQHVFEQKDPKKPEVFCEQSWLYHWVVDQGTISGYQKQISDHTSHGGALCKSWLAVGGPSQKMDWAYELTGDTLKIRHKDLHIKSYNKDGTSKLNSYCEESADFWTVFHRH